MTTEVFEPSYTIAEFCAAERISAPVYYNLKKKGLGPNEMRHGGAIRISHQERLRWQKAREKPTKDELEIAERIRARSIANAAKATASIKHIAKRRKA